MTSPVDKALAKNMAFIRDLERKAKLLGELPMKMAEYFANGGPGNANPVVGDRFMPTGNARFAPLSKDYLEWKSENSAIFNKKQKETYGKGSRLLQFAKGMRFNKASGQMEKRFGKVLPILVLSGDLRHSVLSRVHRISRVSKERAVIHFSNLPDYALYHHDPKSAPFPKRSPVEPNAEDLEKVRLFATRWITAQLGARRTGQQAMSSSKPSVI